MDRNDVCEFLKIEKKYNLYEVSVDGVQYWNYLRFPIWNHNICSGRLNLNQVDIKHKVSFLEKTKKYLSLLCHCILKSRIPKREVDVLFLNHSRRIWKEGKYECAYTERLSEMFVNSVTLETPYDYTHFTPTTTQGLMYADYILALGNIYYNLIKLFKKKKYDRIYNLVIQQMKEPLNDLKEKFSWQYDEKILFHRFVKIVLLHKIQKKLCTRLLDKLKPKAIVEVVGYTSLNMIINEIAKEKGIPTIELQHGTMHSEHIAYQYAANSRLKQFPDMMFLFSDIWKQQINVPIKDENLIVTGYPLFDEKRQAIKDIIIDEKRTNILFISQGTVGVYLSELAVELKKKLSDKDFHIIYKLHPAEYATWRVKYPWLIDSGIEVVDNLKKSIYEYFANCKVQIGVYSTAIYEGLGFDLETYILKAGHSDTMSSLVMNGYAYYIESADDAIALMNKNEREQRNTIEFWKSNALENIVKEIKLIIN